jgi:hypothetical protein
MDWKKNSTPLNRNWAYSNFYSTVHMKEIILKEKAPGQERFSPVLYFYLLLSIAGAIVPWYFNIKAMQQYDTLMILGHYFEEGMATALSSSITTDFFIGTIPVLIWMCMEARQLKMKCWWLLIPATFLVSFAFSCPLFFALREYYKQ